MGAISNDLTPAQLERLALLSEEMGEVQQVIGKIIRHGYMSYHPNDPTTSNKMLLHKELADVVYAIALMEANEEIDGDLLCNIADKVDKRKYLYHQGEYING